MIQRELAELRDRHGWTQQQIASATGVALGTVKTWLVAYDEQVTSGSVEVNRLTPVTQQDRSDRAVATRVIAAASADEIEALVEKLPEETKVDLARAVRSTSPKRRKSGKGSRRDVPKKVSRNRHTF